MPVRVIYIAGPFRAPTAWGIEQNIRRAEEAALEVWRMGAAALCPHTNTRFFHGAAPDDVWLAGDIEMMLRCDAVLRIPGMSEGADAEARAASGLMPIFRDLDGLREWLGA